MAENGSYGCIVSVRLDSELDERVVRYQEQEKRRAKGEMVRTLIEEALDRRDAALKRKRA